MHIVERIPHTFSLNHKIFLLLEKSICYHYNIINNHIKEFQNDLRLPSLRLCV